MGLNPSNFNDSMKQAVRKQYARGIHAYNKKILKVLSKLYGYTVSDVRYDYNMDDEDALAEFKHRINDPELDVIFMKKLTKQKIDHFIYKMDKTKAWDAFFETHEKYKIPLLGVVFPMEGHSDWIIHNLGLMSVPGAGRIIVPSKKAELRDIIVEPLEFFINGRKEA